MLGLNWSNTRVPSLEGAWALLRQGKKQKCWDALSQFFDQHVETIGFYKRVERQLGAMIDEFASRAAPKKPNITERFEHFFLMVLEQFERREEHEITAQLASQYLEARSESEKVATFLASCLIKQAKPNEAAECLEDFFQQHGGSLEFCVAAMQNVNFSHRTENVYIWATRILETNPQHVEAIYKVASYFEDIKQLSSALPLFDFAEVDESADPLVVFMLAISMMNAGDFENAGRILDQALVLNPSFTLLSSAKLANKLASANLKDGVAAGRSLLLSGDRIPDPFYVYQDLIAAIEEKADAYPNAVADLREFKTGLQTRREMDQDRERLYWIDQNRLALGNIRNTPESRFLRRAQPILVSLICPVHRRRDVENLIDQIDHQTWRNAEAMIAVNGGRVTADDIEAVWRAKGVSDITLRIVDCQDLTTISPILNRAIDHSSGSYIARMDADDLYMPDYVADKVLTAQHFRIDLTGNNPHFVYYQARDSLAIGNHQDVLSMRKPGEFNFMTGGTLFFKRSLFDTVRFGHALYNAEDVDFVQRSIGLGFNARYSGPFNYLYTRSGLAENHTWDPIEAYVYSISSHIHLGGKETIEKLVWY